MGWRNDDAPDSGHEIVGFYPAVDVRVGELVDHPVDVRFVSACELCELGNS